MVSGQVLADKPGHLQHVETRHGEHRLQRTVGLDDPPLVELVHRTEMCHGDDARDVNPVEICLLYTSPSPRDRTRSRMPSSA